MSAVLDFLNGMIWSPPLLILALCAGLYFTIVTRVLQLRLFGDMVKYLFRGTESVKGLSSFQAFALAVSGRVGTGNIAGVATAIALGGPGALFWMWVIAFVGAGSAFVEATLAQLYKKVQDGQFRGGPSFYIEKGLGLKWYAQLFAVAMLLSTGFFLPGIQSNSIAGAMENAFTVSPLLTGGVLAALMGLIIFGGVKRLGHTAQMVVPVMAVGYVLVAIVVVVVNIGKLPETLALIFRSAFAMDATFGGMVGMAISWGVRRGIYSNEAGQGTAPMAAATADVTHPAKQGLVQAFSVYFDTWLVCTATGLMILLSGMYNVLSPDGSTLVENLPGVDYGPAFTQAAVDSVVPGVGSGFVAIALFFFAFTTLMAYYYYAETNIAYLVRSATSRKRAFFVLRLVFLAIIAASATTSVDAAWAMGDIGVGMTAWLNLIAILLLAKPALACLRDYEAQKKQGIEPIYVSEDPDSVWKAK